VFAFDRIRRRPALRVALDAGVAGIHVIHSGGIHHVFARRVRRVFAAGTVAAFAADVPLNYLLGVNVVVNRVAAVAEGPGWAAAVFRTIERRPPVRIVRDVFLIPSISR